MNCFLLVSKRHTFVKYVNMKLILLNQGTNNVEPILSTNTKIVNARL